MQHKMVSVLGVAALSAFLALWELVDQVQPWSMHGTSTSLPIGVLVILANVAVGVMVARIWSLLALAAPLAVLAVLEISGYISPYHDGTPPLTYRSVFLLSFFAMLILLGVLLGSRRTT